MAGGDRVRLKIIAIFWRRFMIALLLWSNSFHVLLHIDRGRLLTGEPSAIGLGHTRSSRSLNCSIAEHLVHCHLGVRNELASRSRILGSRPHGLLGIYRCNVQRLYLLRERCWH